MSLIEGGTDDIVNDLLLKGTKFNTYAYLLWMMENSLFSFDLRSVFVACDH